MDLDTPHFDAKRRRKDGRNGPNTTEWSSKPARLSVAFLTRAVEKISNVHADRAPTRSLDVSDLNVRTPLPTAFLGLNRAPWSLPDGRRRSQHHTHLDR